MKTKAYMSTEFDMMKEAGISPEVLTFDVVRHFAQMGAGCLIPTADIADLCGCSDRTVQRLVKKLIAAEVLHEEIVLRNKVPKRSLIWGAGTDEKKAKARKHLEEELEEELEEGDRCVGSTRQMCRPLLRR